jgi:hypothetical protein
MQTSKRLGMVTLNDALLEHVDAGDMDATAPQKPAAPAPGRS